MNVLAKRTTGLVMSLMLVAACGGSSTSSPALTGAATVAPSGGASGSTGGSAAPTTGEPVTLDLWIFEGEDAIVPKFKEGFESSHKNITLNISLVPEDLYVTKLETAFAAGDPPDLAFVYNAQWMKAGQFFPINDVLAAGGVDTSTFAQTALSICSLDDTLYCMGSYTGMYVLYYDRKLFDAAAIAYPSATEGMPLDTYAEIARKLAHDDADLSKRVWGGTTGGPEAAIDNRAFFSPDGKSSIGYFDDQPTTHAMSVLAHMANDKSGLTYDALPATGMGDPTDLMPTHQLGMTPADATALPDLEANGVDVGIAPPYVEQAGDPFWVPQWTDAWGVPTKSAHPDEAKQFIVWVATEGQKVRAEAGNLPLDIKLATTLDWAGDSPEKQALVAMAAKGRPFLFVPGAAADISPIIDDAWSQVVENEADAESIVKDTAQTIQDQLDKNWAAWERIQ